MIHILLSIPPKLTYKTTWSPHLTTVLILQTLMDCKDKNEDKLQDIAGNCNMLFGKESMKVRAQCTFCINVCARRHKIYPRLNSLFFILFPSMYL